MCAFDKDYRGNLAYPKHVVRLSEMGAEERSFVDDVTRLLEGRIKVDDLVVEQRFADYRTVVYGDWDNDFLRYHFGSDGFWASVRMYPEMIDEYEFSPLFSAQANKKQLHWRSSVSATEISKLTDVLARSARGFFENHGKAYSRPKSKRPGDALRRSIEGLALSVPKFKELIGDGYELIDNRDAILAGANHYAASSKLRNGSVLTCEHEKDSPYDEDAVAVYDERHEMVAHLPNKGSSKRSALGAISEGQVPMAVVIDDGTDGGTRRKRKNIHIALFTIGTNN